MAGDFDELERQSPEAREARLMERAAVLLAGAVNSPFWAERLPQVGTGPLTREALEAIPVLRKSELPALQAATPPFGGLSSNPAGGFPRLFLSPGPIAEPQAGDGDFWNAARGFHAAGLRAGDILLNTFGYHLTPGGFVMDCGARALGCAVIPAGPGNTEQQVQAIERYRPSAYAGTADFLNILVQAADAAGVELSIRTAICSGAAAPPSLRAAFYKRGIEVFEFYATAELGLIAYESEAHDGLVVNEDTIVELLEPGSGRPVGEGEVGEVVVTRPGAAFPLIRLATGDLSRFLPGTSSCGRTGRRLAGWLGRADETAKVKGMFVHPAQVRQVAAAAAGQVSRARFVVTRESERDVLTLEAETAEDDPALAGRLEAALRDVTRLGGQVRLMRPGEMEADPRSIVDARRYD